MTRTRRAGGLKRAAVSISLILLGWLWTQPAQAGAPRLAYELVEHATPATLCPGEARRVEVSLRNVGELAWSPALEDFVAYHWDDADGTQVVFDGVRTRLDDLTAVGDDAHVQARLVAPKTAGAYRLTWTMVREGLRWYPVREEPVAVQVRGSGPALAASFGGALAPARWEAGVTGFVDIAVTNAGCAAWDPAFGDRLTYRWYDADTDALVVDEGARTDAPVLAPGGEASVTLRVVAPDAPGRYRLEPALVREGLAWGTADSDVAVVVDIAASPHAWTVRSEAPWSSHAAGDKATIELTLDNVGTTTWSPADADRLSYRIVDAAGETVVAEGRRTELPGPVAPGESVSVVAEVDLPRRAGDYVVRWAMVREGVRWYDPPRRGAELSLAVQAPRLAWQLVDIEVPATMWTVRTQAVAVTLRNVGTQAWTPELSDNVSYRWLEADGTVVVADGERTHLAGPVAPGQTVTLSMRVRGPPAPGQYRLQIEMVREHVRWYGAPLDAPPATRPVSAHRLADALMLGWLLVSLAVAIAMHHLRHRPTTAVVRRWVAIAWLAVSTYLLAECFVDYAGVEPWDGARRLAASGGALLAWPLCLLPRRARGPVAVVLAVFVTLLVVADLGYLHFFGSIVPLSALFALGHLGDARQTVVSLLEPEYAWLVAAPVSVFVAAWLGRRTRAPRRPHLERWIAAAALAVFAAPAAAGLWSATFSALGSRVFSEQHNVGRFGVVNAHLFELSRAVRELVTGPDALAPGRRDAIEAAYAARRSEAVAERSPQFGVAAGASVIVLQVEALQQWVVDAKVGGEPVMPFLSVAADVDALRFDHVFDQTAQGRTSDAEYLVLGSGHALAAGALCFARADNEFWTLAHAAAERGYRTLSGHPYKRGFWNRATLHPRYGFASSSFRRELGDGPMVGWGLADGPFLSRMVPSITEGSLPVFAFLITLSLHHPYEHFPAAFERMRIGAMQGTPLGNYLHAMRYFDESLQQFMADLDAAGRLDDTIVVVYGDHVSRLGSGPDVRALAGYDDWDPALPTRLARVPLLMWIPDGKAHGLVGRRDIVGGQIDVAPTVAELLGWDAPLPAATGRSLLRTGPGFVALPDGGAITGDRMFVADGREIPKTGACFGYPVGAARPRADCEAAAEAAALELDLSRDVLDHDLARDVGAR